eukprot:scaffold131841_cov75-Phaeocystis_antarctica.AAC.3
MHDYAYTSHRLAHDIEVDEDVSHVRAGAVAPRAPPGGAWVWVSAKVNEKVSSEQLVRRVAQHQSKGAVGATKRWSLWPCSSAVVAAHHGELV